MEGGGESPVFFFFLRSTSFDFGSLSLKEWKFRGFGVEWMGARTDEERGREDDVASFVITEVVTEECEPQSPEVCSQT